MFKGARGLKTSGKVIYTTADQKCLKRYVRHRMPSVKALVNAAQLYLQPPKKQIITETGRKRYRKVSPSYSNLDYITKHHINRLAARAGCIKVSGLIYQEIRRHTLSFLVDMISNSNSLCRASKQGPSIVLPEHVQAVVDARGRTLWGTGRLHLPFHGTHPYQRTGPDPEGKIGRGGFGHEFAIRRATAQNEKGFGSVERAKYVTGDLLAKIMNVILF